MVYKNLKYMILILASVIANSDFAFSQSQANKSVTEEAQSKIDIRAVGDTAYIGDWSPEETIEKGLPQGKAPEGYFDRRLNGMIPLRSPHINILNLEASLTRSCKSFASKTYQFATTPESVIEFAKWGFNMMALANNHSLDCVDPGARKEIRPSLALIRKAVPNVALHGVSYHADQLTRVAIQEINGIRVGMVSIKGWAVGPHQVVGNISNRKKIFNALKNAKVDIRILSFHAGEELSRTPTGENLKVVHEFISDYNGDAVFAHHPHVMQGIEILKKKNGRSSVIFHSLGNFLHDGLSRKQDGMMGRIEVTKNGIIPDSTQIFPLEAESYKPKPIRSEKLSAAIAVIKSSTENIAKMPIHTDLTRTEFEFFELLAPIAAIGVKIKSPQTLASNEESKPIKPKVGDLPIKQINYPTSGTMGDIKVIDSTHN